MKRKNWKTAIGLLVALAAICSIVVVPAVIADDDAETATPAPTATPPEPGERCEAFMGKVADNLDVTVEDLQQGMKAARIAMIDEAVAAGTIDADMAEQMKRRIEENDSECGMRGGFGRMQGGPGRCGGFERHGWDKPAMDDSGFPGRGMMLFRSGDCPMATGDGV